jgi:serine/threonine protein kinase
MSLENTALDVEDEDFVDELKPGTKLMHGQYTIEGFLAAGGFGITYLAKDSLNRQVVIKECFPGSFCRRQNHSVTPRSRAHQNELKSIVRLFSQEAMSLAKANHPNIVGVHQVFEENNTAYMAMDFVEGRDLLEILQENPESLTPDLVESYLTKILDAIKHIHDMGILHRDISPDNILIDADGEPILIDFGAARESTNEKATRMLSALRVVKDGYSPQEFYIAGSDQTPSCDLYSLAASFYHLITGELPPDSQWRLSACAAGDDDPYVSLGEKTDAYSKNFVTALDKAIAILPRERMQNAEEWIAHMTNAAPVAPAATIETSTVSEVTNSNKSMMPALLGTTAVAAAIGGFIVFSSSGSETPADVSEQSEVAVVAQTGSNAPATEPTGTPENSVVTPPVETAGTAGVPGLEQPSIDQLPTSTGASDTDTLITGVTNDIAEPPIPTGDDTTGTFDAPVVASLPESVNAPKPRPLRDSDATLIELAKAQPDIDTQAPAAPETASAAEPNAANEIAVAPESQASTSEGVEFFMSLQGSQPELVSTGPNRTAVTTSQTRASATAPAPQSDTTAAAESSPVVLENYPIEINFVPVLPVALSNLQPGVVTEVAADAPEWLTANTQIVSINGRAVSSNEDINDRLAAFATPTDAGSVELTIGTISGVNDAAFERTLSVETEEQMTLPNGLKFATRQVNGAWTTEVVDAPSSVSLNVGDVLVSFVSTWESLDAPNSLKTILERELLNGTTSFSFAVKRDGEVWVEAFNLAAAGN